MFGTLTTTEAHKQALQQFLQHLDTMYGGAIVRTWLEPYLSNTLPRQPAKKSPSVCNVCCPNVQYSPRSTSDAAGSPSKAESSPRVRAHSASGPRSRSPRNASVAAPLHAPQQQHQASPGHTPSSRTKPSVSPDPRLERAENSRPSVTKSWADVFIAQVTVASRTLGSLAIPMRFRHEAILAIQNILQQGGVQLSRAALGSNDLFLHSAQRFMALLALQLTCCDVPLVRATLSAAETTCDILGSLFNWEIAVPFVLRLLEMVHSPLLVLTASEAYHVIEIFVRVSKCMDLLPLFVRHLLFVVQETPPKGISPRKFHRPNEIFFASAAARQKAQTFFATKSMQLLNDFIERTVDCVRFVFEDTVSTVEYFIPLFSSAGEQAKYLEQLREALAKKVGATNPEQILLATRGEAGELYGIGRSASRSDGATSLVSSVLPSTRRFVDGVHPLEVYFARSEFLTSAPDERHAQREGSSHVNVLSSASSPPPSQVQGHQSASSGADRSPTPPPSIHLNDLTPLFVAEGKEHHQQQRRRSESTDIAAPFPDTAERLWHALAIPEGPNSISSDFGHLTFTVFFLLFPTEAPSLLRTTTSRKTQERVLASLFGTTPDGVPLRTRPQQAFSFLLSGSEIFDAWDSFTERKPKVPRRESEKCVLVEEVFGSSPVKSKKSRSAAVKPSKASEGALRAPSERLFYSANYMQPHAHPSSTRITSFRRTSATNTYMYLGAMEAGQSPITGPFNAGSLRMPSRRNSNISVESATPDGQGGEALKKGNAVAAAQPLPGAAVPNTTATAIQPKQKHRAEILTPKLAENQICEDAFQASFKKR